MPSIKSLYRLAARASLPLVALGLAACSLDNQAAPSLSGPSEFGLAVTMAASPDQLPRDGSSQSVVTVTVRDAQGRAVSGQRVSLSLPANAPAGALLSQAEIVTGSGGQASFAVTAPVSGSLGNIVISATPVGTNAGNAAPRVISITANPTNGSAPTAAFTFSPTPPVLPEVGEVVTFDASNTKDEGVACGTCTYTWSFGGDGTASGIIVKHAFGAGGPYLVTLTVTDVGGSTSTTQQTVTVTTLAIPTALTITPSPLTPIAGQPATFTASATAATNHRIVTYQFIWGDGSTDSRPGSPVILIQHTYSQSGSYLLTLTVTDDQKQSSTFNKVITVSSGLTADFATSSVGNDVTFDASTLSLSSVASTITDYAWDFDGDGIVDANGSSPTITHTYISGTYKVTLTITDNRGTTQKSAAQTVVVP